MVGDGQTVGADAAVRGCRNLLREIGNMLVTVVERDELGEEQVGDERLRVARR